jgi:hypothetical protein
MVWLLSRSYLYLVVIQQVVKCRSLCSVECLTGRRLERCLGEVDLSSCRIAERANIILWLTRWIMGDWVRTSSLLWSLYACTTSLDFSKALSVPAFLIWSTNRELKILTPCGTSAISTSSKTPFSSRPLSSFLLESVYVGEGEGGLRSSCKKIDMSAVFCRNRAGGLRVRVAFRCGCSSCSAGSSSSSLYPDSGLGYK